MRRLARVGVILSSSATLVLGGLIVAGPAAAAISCHSINAKGVGQDHGNGQTTANINGGGLLNGTTAGSFTISSLSGSVATIDGTVVFTTHQGTLTVSVHGTFDVAQGDFSANGPISAATGKLAGATGNLTLGGHENLATGSFTEKISGNVCVDLAP